MATSSRGERLRYRYGICLNDNCSKCKSKEVQQIAARKEFICEECGKSLRECPPPKTSWQKYGKLIMGGSVAAILAIVVILLTMLPSGNSNSGEKVEKDSTVVVTPPEIDKSKDEDKTKETTKTEDEKPQELINGRGTVNLGYGKYTGDLKNSKPHGWGKITYTKSTKIVNSKDFVANPGDTFEGEFRDGKISGQGYWTHDGNQTVVKP